MNPFRSTLRRAAAAAAAFVTLGAPLAPTAGLAASGTTPSPGRVRSLHDFRVRTNEGADRSLADFRGKVVLVVNTASRCGFTPQYESLESLYQREHARGFEILAFPANNFMGQEPGDDAEIRSFCTLNYHVTFPLFAKIDVKGKTQAPLYTWLTKESPYPGDIRWNFTKFLVDRQGHVIARFEPNVDPLDPKVLERIEAALKS